MRTYSPRVASSGADKTLHVPDQVVDEVTTAFVRHAVRPGGADTVELAFADAMARAFSCASAAVEVTTAESRSISAASDVGHRLAALLQRLDPSPLTESQRTGSIVSIGDVTADDRWPAATRPALQLGIRTLLIAPLHADGQHAGWLWLFDDRPRRWAPGTAEEISEACERSATLLVSARALSSMRALNDQLAHALRSRIVIEQAKGITAVRLGLSMEAAFAVLRDHARRTRTTVRSVAEAVVRLRTPPPTDGPDGRRVIASVCDAGPRSRRVVMARHRGR